MGIQSSINSALSTLRVLGALNSGKKYIDQQVQKGAESVKDAAKDVGKQVKGAAKDVGEQVKEAAKGIEMKVIPLVDKYGNKIDRFGNVMTDEYRSELQRRSEELKRAKAAQESVYAKLKSKQDARESVSNMKGILKGDVNVNDLLHMDQSQIGKEPKIEENNLNGGAN